MARLILEEGGNRRAFKVGEGRLTIGSGQGCSLRLTSPGVAEVHAELELTAGVAYLRPRPGVMPPLMHGQPVTHQVPLSADAHFEIGAAKFHYLAEDSGSLPQSTAPRPAAAAAAGAPSTAPAGPRKAPPRAPARAAAPSAAGPRAKAAAGPAAEGVQRTRPRVTVKRGIPTWLMLVLIGAGLLIAAFAVRGMLGGAGQVTVIPEATLARARQLFDSREFDAARKALAMIPRDQVSDGLRSQIVALEAEMDRVEGGVALDREYKREADDYRSTQLERFMKDRLLGDNPPRERVRVFLKRLQTFRERWPGYPDMEWVDRHERLYSRLANLSEPPTLKDLAYEVETLTWAKPRDYRQAAALVRKFIETATGSERQDAVALLDELAAAEQLYFDDQMQQAKYHWERKESGKSVGVLISLVVDLDDPEFIDQAASELMQLPGFEAFLKSYRTSNPRRYDDLVQNPRIKAVAQRLGLL